MSRISLFWILVFVFVPTPARAVPPIVFPEFIFTPPHDPFPLRRVFLTPKQFADLTLPSNAAPLVKIPQAEFERRVRQAALAQKAITPFISSARYSAQYVEGALSGTAAWTIQNPNQISSVLTFDPIRIALKNPQWSDGTAAHLFRKETESAERVQTAVIVDASRAANPQILKCDWSARGTDERGERRFDLQFPSSAVSSFDLILPLSLIPVVHLESSLMTGPYESSVANHRRWHIEFGGIRKFGLTIKSANANTVAVSGQASAMVRWNLSSANAEGQYQFTLDRHHINRDNYQFLIDTRLRITDVVSDSAIEWNISPVDATHPKATLYIRPVDSTSLNRVTLLTTAEAPLPKTPWEVPAVTFVGGLPSDEQIQLRMVGELQLAAMRPGDFRVTDHDHSDSGRRSMNFEGSFSNEKCTSRLLPTITFTNRNSLIAVTERSQWDVRRDENRLRITSQITVQRGPIQQIDFSIPSGFSLVTAPAIANDPTAEWRQDGQSSKIVFTHPLATGQSTTFTATISSRTSISPAGHARLIVPALIWQNADRTGTTHVNPSNDFLDSSPYVIAYQDLPPASESIFSTEPAQRPSSQKNDTLPKQPIASPRVNTTQPPRQHIRIGNSHCSAVISGSTPPNVNEPFSISLPEFAAIDSLLVNNRWVEYRRNDSNEIEIPADNVGINNWELKYHVPRKGWWIEHLTSQQAYPDSQWSADTGWTLWPYTNGQSVWVIRTSLIQSFGMIIAGLLLIPIYHVLIGVHHGRARLFFALSILFFVPFVLFDSAITFAGLPTTIALFGLILSYFRKQPKLITATAMMLACPLFAQSPSVSTVYLVNGTGTESNQLFTLAPQSVLDQLDRITRAAPPAVMVTKAEYAASESTDEVAFEAKWEVFVNQPGTHRLEIPLSNANLTTVQFDGSNTFPDSLPTGGFAVRINAAGVHQLTARFNVPIKTVGTEKEVRFLGPDTPQSQLIFQVNRGSRGVTISPRRGLQTLTLNDRGPQVTAEIGDGRAISIRWRPNRNPIPVSKLDFTNEIAVCDCDEGTSTMTAAFTYPASRGGSRYRIAIPNGWQVTRIIGRFRDSGSTLPFDWTISNTANRIVTIVPRILVEERVAFVLELAAEHVLSTKQKILFPRDLDAPDPNAIYGLRTHGINLNEFHREGAVDIPVDLLTKESLGFPELNLESQPALRAVRRKEIETVISPVFSITKQSSTATQSLTLTVGRRTDLFAELSWQNSIPAWSSILLPEQFESLTVRGTDLLDWNRNGDQLNFWLRTNEESGTVRWNATLGMGAIGKRKVPLPKTTSQSILRIRPVTDWRVRVVPTKGVQPIADKPDQFEVDATVSVIEIECELGEVSPPAAPSFPPSTESTAVTPSASQPTADIIPETPQPISIPYSKITLWLSGFVLILMLPSLTTADLRPEQIMGLGILGCVAVGIGFAVFVIVGIFVRIAKYFR